MSIVPVPISFNRIPVSSMPATCPTTRMFLAIFLASFFSMNEVKLIALIWLIRVGSVIVSIDCLIMFPQALSPVHGGGPFDSFLSSLAIPIPLALLCGIELEETMTIFIKIIVFVRCSSQVVTCSLNASSLDVMNGIILWSTLKDLYIMTMPLALNRQEQTNYNQEQV